MKALAIILLLLPSFLISSIQGQCDPDHPCRSPNASPNFGARGGQTYDGPPTTGPQGPPVIIIPPPVIFPENPQIPFAPAPPDFKKLLDKHGPQFADTFSMSSFSVLAYAKGSWPLVIDYQQEKESFALLVVAVEGIEPFYYRLQGTNKGHFQEIVQLPPRFGDKPVVANYFVRALAMNTGEVKPTLLQILGLGAGDKAVASVGIDKIVFQPRAIRPPQREKAMYTFHSEFDFPEVEAGVMKVGLMNSQIIAARVSQNHIKDGIRQNAQVSKDWDGKRGGKPCLGKHILQVRAWRSSQDGGDWVAAWSTQLVEVVP
jgi:hypothetical protein